MIKESISLPITSIIVIDNSITTLLVFQCCYRNSTKQATSWQTSAVHMVSEQVGYKGNGKRRGDKVALDKAEVHDKEEKMQDTSLYNGNYTKNDR